MEFTDEQLDAKWLVLGQVEELLKTMNIPYYAESGGDPQVTREPHIVIYVPPAEDRADRWASVVYREPNIQLYEETQTAGLESVELLLLGTEYRKGWEDVLLNFMKQAIWCMYPQLCNHKELRKGTDLIAELRSLRDGKGYDLEDLLERTIGVLKALGCQESDATGADFEDRPTDSSGSEGCYK